MQPVTIVGNAPHKHVPSGEIWAMNVGAMKKPHVDLVLDIHTTAYLLRTASTRYLDWLSRLTIPLYMREQTVSNATLYPYQDVYDLTKNVRHNEKHLKFFTSSVPLAIALAVLQNRPKITVCGVELVMMQDYRDCFAFWVGFSGGRGIELEIVGANVIFDRPIYGEFE
jgi:hypothetical protein